MREAGTDSGRERPVGQRLRRRGRRALRRTARRLPALALCWAAVGRAAAQDAGQIACSLGLGDLFVVALGALAAFHVVKGIVVASLAASKLGSARPQRQYEGKKAMTGAAISTAGAIFPILAGAVLTEVVGVSLWACLRFV